MFSIFWRTSFSVSMLICDFFFVHAHFFFILQDIFCEMFSSVCFCLNFSICVTLFFHFTTIFYFLLFLCIFVFLFAFCTGWFFLLPYTVFACRVFFLLYLYCMCMAKETFSQCNLCPNINASCTFIKLMRSGFNFLSKFFCAARVVLITSLWT